MQITLIVALVLHVLSGVFWAGTTFALARTGGNQADRFFRPQMGAAAVVAVTGGLLWFLLHHGPRHWSTLRAPCRRRPRHEGRTGPAKTHRHGRLRLIAPS